MTREEKSNLLNELLEYEENNDIGNLTRAERREFQQWISETLEQEPCEDAISRAQAQTEIEMNACRYTLARERDSIGQVEWSNQLIKVSDAVDIIRHLPSVTSISKSCESQESEDKE